MPDDEYRELARESIAQFSRREPDPQVLDSLLGRIRYVGGTFDDPSVYERLETCALEYDEEAGHPVQPRLLPLDRAVVLPGDRRSSSASTASTAARTPRSAS